MDCCLTKDGTKLEFRVRGNGPHDLLFLHGWGGSAGFWEPFLDRINLKGKRAICLSFRGHGESGKANCGYNLFQFSEDTLAVLDAVQSKSAVLIGFSMGGKIAQLFSAQHPDRVAGQVLVAPVGPGQVHIPMDTAREYFDAARDENLLAPLFRPWVKKIPESLFHQVLAEICRTPRFVLEKTFSMLAGTSIIEEISRATPIPSLLVAGTEDPLYGPGYQQERVLVHFKKAALEITHCGHFIPLESPDELEQLIKNFLVGPEMLFPALRLRQGRKWSTRTGMRNGLP